MHYTAKRKSHRYEGGGSQDPRCNDEIQNALAGLCALNSLQLHIELGQQRPNDDATERMAYDHGTRRRGETNTPETSFTYSNTTVSAARRTDLDQK